MNAGHRRYTVLVDDNFHYQDEDERCELGRFETAAEAVAACQGRVDKSLRWLHAQRPGSSPAELYDYYLSFGDEPFIVAEGDRVDFSAWTYAKERSEVVARPQLELPLSGDTARRSNDESSASRRVRRPPGNVGK
jgi:hypothetical protein